MVLIKNKVKVKTGRIFTKGIVSIIKEVAKITNFLEPYLVISPTLL